MDIVVRVGVGSDTVAVGKGGVMVVVILTVVVGTGVTTPQATSETISRLTTIRFSAFIGLSISNSNQYYNWRLSQFA